jgi:hypothetical protein
MNRETPIDPPIVVQMFSGSLTLSTVEQVIDYVRRHSDYHRWVELREAAFVAAAVPSAQNIDALRRIALETIK